MRYLVDSVPWFFKPAFWLYGYGLGVPAWLGLRLWRLLCRIELRGQEWLDALPSHILTSWHDQTVLGLIAFSQYGNHTWMNHPAAYMKPVHVMLSLLGIRHLVLGSTGHDGRAAAAELVEWLKRGRATAMMPDGPSGPPHQLKKGVLHIAAQSGVPILPVRFALSSSFRLPGWDRKYVPYPFSRIVVHIGPPIQVDPDHLDDAAAELLRHLDP